MHEKAVEINKFVHYYTRYKNHENSYKIEEPLLALAKSKFELLSAQADNGLVRRDESAQAIPISDGSSNDDVTPTTAPPLMRRLTQSFEKGVLRILHQQSSNDEADMAAAIEHRRKSSSSSIVLADQNTEMEKLVDSANELKSGFADEQLQVLSLDEIRSEVTAKETDESSMQQHLFFEKAIRELLKSRRILRCSYVYGYYLDTFGHKKFIFEFIQTEFEESTENLSQIIARPALKTPKNKIIR